MSAPEIVKQLVERFEQHRDAYRSGKYNETQLRREFLDPFFEALGWDVLNRLGYSEENKHVIHEDSLEIEGVKKAPDYAFKIGRERKFFVEAKKPSVKIESNPEVAFQLRRYVWSAKLPLGILTDFEEFAVYECRSKPKSSDSVKTGRVALFKYTDFIERWDEIASIFSYEAVMKGGFDSFANTAAKKKGTAEVDEAFLAEIEGWRDTLAKNIALRNKARIHHEADLNFAVQMTIDRVIFLRICEERGFEPENQLHEISRRENIFAELSRLFERADKRYNSGLFHFRKESGRGAADTFTPTLEIDDKVLKEIIRDLYYPSPYVFSQIPADILGQIYEQFLGKVIRLTAGAQAKVEEKPEVRKAGGVFYTPTYIVDYIVANSVGRLLDPTPIPSPDGKTPSGEGRKGMTPAEVAKLKIVDPACGSGTFLLGAFQFLIDWHLRWYLEHDPEKWAKGKNPALIPLPHFGSSKMGEGRGGGWKLSVAKKKEILLNNIHGVDIDPQAVEVTKLSLLLKVIEDPGQLSLLDERILPDLGKNIQCGNSLIGRDYFEGQLMVEEAERARVNAFDWKQAFPDVFAQGGFDAVIGNPPYGASFTREDDLYFSGTYETFSATKDVYTCFIEKALLVSKGKGRVAFIVPSGWTGGPQYSLLRFYLLNYQIESLVLLPFDVFKDAYIDTLIFVIENLKAREKHSVKTYTYPKR
ncbi:MAG: N-6 DNA methylase, partial [Chloroflexota bacterium]